MSFPPGSSANFVFVSPHMFVLISLLRKIKVSMLLSSFFLSCECIMGILSFWANIHLSWSAYNVCYFVFVLPHSG